MLIKVKYNIGDTVYLINDNLGIEELTIKKIEISEHDIYYTADEEFISYSQDDIYATKPEAYNELLGRLQPVLDELNILTPSVEKSLVDILINAISKPQYPSRLLGGQFIPIEQVNDAMKQLGYEQSSCGIWFQDDVLSEYTLDNQVVSIFQNLYTGGLGVYVKGENNENN